MQATRFIAILIASALFARTSSAQSFQNLNFESANPVPVVGNPYYPDYVTTASALPGWTATIGGVQQADVFYNLPSLGAPQITLVSTPIMFAYTGPIDGNYSVFLQGTGTYDAAISQTGLIPVGTQSLLFDAASENYSPLLAVSIGGQDVPISAVGSGPNSSTIYGANLSAWAGQTEQLTISSPVGFWLVDDIQFSQNAIVPEPAPLALAALAGLASVLLRKARP